MALAPHPRLLLGEQELPRLRARLTHEPIKSMLARLRADAETDDYAASGSKAETPYGEATAAQRCAYLWLLTGEPHWAERARHYTERRLADPKWAEKNQKGLTLYYIGKAVALAYDACFAAPSWDRAFREHVAGKLRALAEVVFTHGGTEQNTNPASNWQALRFSAAGLCYLALDDTETEPAVEQCYQRVRAYLQQNLGESPQSRGWNAEGLGYTYYPMGNGVCPFAIALQRRFPQWDLRKDVPALAYTLWTCYAALVKTRQGLFRPDFGDDNPGTSAEGTLGFAFHFCPPELLPGLRYWYDRTVGTLGNRTYDATRFGTLASILYYPLEVPSQAPLSLPAWRALLPDPQGNGYFTWRNRYQDEGDLVAQVYVKRRGNRGHSGPDALSFRLVGQNALWATGGGRYGLKLNGLDAYLRSMNTLYPTDPDGPLTISKESGTVLAHDDRSLVCRIAKNNVGVVEHTRRFGVDFSEEGAVFVFYDTSHNGRYWQLCTLEDNRIERLGPTLFQLTSAQGDTLRGTVLSASGDPQLTIGTRVRGSSVGSLTRNHFVHTQSQDGCHLIVLTLAAKGKPHPAVQASGTWGPTPNGTVQIGTRHLQLQGDSLQWR